MSNNSAKFRALCIQHFILSEETPEKAAETLISNLRENPKNHEQFRLPLTTAEGIIRATFVRTYDTNGKYLSTLPPVELRNLVKQEPAPSEDTPDLEYAATLTKEDLDVYAETFGINLNRSMTKANMLIDFEKQLEEKQ